MRPIENGGDLANYTQTDEEDMGMTYEELGIFGRLRKISRCGPVKMFIKLLDTWKELAPTVVADKVCFISVDEGTKLSMYFFASCCLGEEILSILLH